MVTQMTNEMRMKIVEAYINGNSAKTIANFLGLQRTTVHMVIKKYLSTGIIEPKTRTVFAPQKLSEENKIVIKQWIDDNCTLTLRAISQMVLTEFNIVVSKSTIAKIITEFSYSLKDCIFSPKEEMIQKQFPRDSFMHNGTSLNSQDFLNRR
jgi:transposase